MSYTYTEIILPEADHFAHRPSAEQLAAVVDVLASAGWVHRSPEGGSYLSVEDAKAAFRTAGHRPAIAHLLAGATDPAPDEWPAAEPLFTPDLCEDVLLISSPLLLLLPGSMNGGSVACPSCNADVRAALEFQVEKAYDEDAPPEYEFVRKGFRLAPERCPSCNNTLNPQDLVLAAHDFEDETPLCHFAVCITAVREPSVEVVYPDPALLATLGEACGAPLRSTGRLQ